VLLAGLCIAFLTEAGQLSWLAIRGMGVIHADVVEPFARSAARPDIVDRKGRLLATDIPMASLYADPSRVIDRDEVSEKLAMVLPGLDQRQLLNDLAHKSKHFLWIKRGLSPVEAKKVHDLGLPGLEFRQELRRVYPAGEDAGHILGFVDIENRGATGIERWIDGQDMVELVDGAAHSERPPVSLSIDIGVQHALRSELERAEADFSAGAAAGLVLDLATGEVIASVSLPDFPAGNAALSLEPDRIDRIAGGTFELGSVMKIVTLAMAEEYGIITPGKLFDAREPLKVGAFTIDDFHPTRRELTAEEVFLHSSNIGASLMADAAGPKRQQEFLGRLGLTSPMETELGKTAPPQLPKRWERLSAMTISFGHGIALAPLQYASAVGSIVTGGHKVSPTFLSVVSPADSRSGGGLVGPRTVAFVEDLMRANVVDPEGTGKHAAVSGYDIGGKTGTADIPGKGGYGQHGVLSSFLAIFPSHQPRYLTFVLLWGPQPTADDHGQTAAGVTAAPLTSRLVARIAPMLGYRPTVATNPAASAFAPPG
jgi:cell division protein FtsI (penicillin-binding protein 3)